ncbi:hypothetical protein [Bradyrhizobium sp. USDA 4529]
MKVTGAIVRELDRQGVADNLVKVGFDPLERPALQPAQREAQLYDALDGDDLRELPLLRRRPEGIFVAPFELGEIGPDLFRPACDMGLKAWSQSAASAAARTCFGSRLRTESTPRCFRVKDALS